MSPSPKVYIAGVGYSTSPGKQSSKESSLASSLSAATKALLDAGVTYDDITHGVSSSSKHVLDAFKAFEDGGVAMNKVKHNSELESSFALIEGQGAQSVLMVAEEESAVIAFVMVSDAFLWHRAYLKDSSALLRPQKGSTGQARKRLYDICQMIWALRGWTDGTSKSLTYQSPSNKGFELSRADERDTPKWKDVEHKQDGKHRLGYNPAKKTEEVTSEDFEAVISTKSRNSKKTSSSHFKRRGGDRAALARL